MTRLSKTSEKSEHIYCSVREIQSVAVDGNTTHLELEVSTIITEDGKYIDNKQVIVEIETLELVQTFNSTWTTHAIGKLRGWLNQIVK